MKRLTIILAATLICTSCGVALYPDRGVTVTASVNISAQPPWGPAGYDYAPYYYFPDFNFYYDVDRAMFHYYSRGRWIAAKKLPVGYPRDLYKFYKVVIDVRDPWLYNRRHKSMYRKYRGIHTQPVLRDTPYRYDNTSQRRNDIRNSRNNDTSSNRNGNTAKSVGSRNASKNASSATRASDNKRNKEKTTDKKESKTTSNRSTGSRGR